MELSRQNLALIGVGGAVVVLGIGIVLANAKIAKDVDKVLAERGELSSTLQSLDRPVRLPDRPPLRINAEIVRREEERVRTVQQDLAEVVRNSTDWNRRNFTVLSTTVQGRVIEAFPVDKQAFIDFSSSLPFNLSRAYLRELGSLLDPLLPAEEISPQKLQEEEPLLADRLRASPEFKGQPEDVINEEARRRARDDLIARSIQGKLIYANTDALDRRFESPTSEATIEDIWYAQISLWVMQDILDAIRLTNEKTVAGLQAPSVVNSAVKRLLRIQVQGYATDETIASLTGRLCSPEYDVLRYRFIVIMPARHIATLQRELMSLNYHTVVNVSTDAIHFPPDSLFEYGPDPVVAATFDGELLLLTTWERGTWDTSIAPAGWSEELPPLMPKQVLDRLPITALREEDTKHRD